MDEKTTLPANHKRSLSVTARHIEQGIKEIEELLTTNRSSKITSKVIRNLNDKERALILNLIKELKTENELMIKKFNLPSEKLYEDRMIRGKISHIWVLLTDSTSKGLKGYGDLLPEQSQQLDKHIDALLDIVHKLQSVIK